MRCTVMKAEVLVFQPGALTGIPGEGGGGCKCQPDARKEGAQGSIPVGVPGLHRKELNHDS